jgi:hypothetical protein
VTGSTIFWLSMRSQPTARKMPRGGHISTATLVQPLSTGGTTQAKSPNDPRHYASASRRMRLFSAASSKEQVNILEASIRPSQPDEVTSRSLAAP